MSHFPIVSLHQVSKTFTTTLAVDNVSLSVQAGQIFALLGPNGAGKSTIVRMIIGMLNPDHGQVLWHDRAGRPTQMDRSQIGYLPEDRGLYKNETVSRILKYFAELRGMPSAQAASAVDEWLTRLDMQQYAKKKLETLSKGNQQKIQIAAALVHGPTFAVLDEPFSGLDPLNQEMLVELISELKAGGMTILLSAHQLNLVERMADEVLLVGRGREVLRGSVPQIKSSSYGGRIIEVEFQSALSANEIESLQQHPDVLEVSQTSLNHLRLLLGATAAIPPWLSRLAAIGTLENLSSSQLSLHDIYLRALGNTASEPSVNSRQLLEVSR